MSGRRASSGLTIGQLFTLTFGFLLASVAIFVLGLWVGRDLANRRQERDEQVMRIAVDPTPTAVAAAAVVAVEEATQPARPTASPAQTAASDERSPTARVTGTARIPSPIPRGTPTAGRAALSGAARFTIQVTATNDQVQALVLAQRLRSKGFDAYTVQTEIGGGTWYRVQAGKYPQEDAAEADAKKLQGQGFEAAFVSPLR